MVKKLRQKFVLINMCLMTLVLLVLFVALYISNSQRLSQESLSALRGMINAPMNFSGLKPQIGGKPAHMPGAAIPSFMVVVNKKGEIVSTFMDKVTISTEVLHQALVSVQSHREDSGILHSLRLRFLKRDTPDGTKIAFADRSEEIRSLHTLLINITIAGISGLVALLGISVYLSGIVLRPVEQAWEQQGRFVADASHELKTPLTVILANLGILQTHPHDTIGQQLKWIKNTQHEAERMKELVNNLLFLAKSDVSYAKYEFSCVNLSDIVMGRLLPFESVAYENGIAIHSDIHENIWVNGNGNDLSQLIGILLDNAFKYAGRSGSVTIGLTYDQTYAYFFINNTGTPIQASDLPHIFERFYRAEKSRGRESGGYGLGLSIADSIASRHQVKITAASSEKQGTTFKFRIKVQNMLKQNF